MVYDEAMFYVKTMVCNLATGRQSNRFGSCTWK